MLPLDPTSLHAAPCNATTALYAQYTPRANWVAVAKFDLFLFLLQFRPEQTKKIEPKKITQYRREMNKNCRAIEVRKQVSRVTTPSCPAFMGRLGTKPFLCSMSSAALFIIRRLRSTLHSLRKLKHVDPINSRSVQKQTSSESEGELIRLVPSRLQSSAWSLLAIARTSPFTLRRIFHLSHSFDHANQCRRGVRAVCKRDTHNRGHLLHQSCAHAFVADELTRKKAVVEQGGVEQGVGVPSLSSCVPNSLAKTGLRQ